MPATSAYRVRNQTNHAINEKIRRETEESVAYFAAHPQQIEQRLHELDEEWDVERMLETASAGVTLFGLVMSVVRGRRWLVLPLAVQGFFLQHAIQGWCPPLPALRRLGFRTEGEIDEERYALKALRGDFSESSPADEAGRAAEVQRVARAARH
jgi:hypothetical protein